jgi:hypothetical protein
LDADEEDVKKMGLLEAMDVDCLDTDEKFPNYMQWMQCIWYFSKVL